jgi:hypothetical protein
MRTGIALTDAEAITNLKGPPMSRARLVRLGATAIIVGALLHIGSCVRELADPVLPRTIEFAQRNNIGSVAHLLWLVGIVVLARSGWARAGRLAWIGYAIAIIGLALLFTAELIIGLTFDGSQTLFEASGPVTAVGMICAGIAVLRSGLVSPWVKFTPLLCGLFVFVVMLPGFVVFGAPNYPALIGWGSCWLLLGIAMWTEAANAQPTTRSAVPAHGR